LVTAPEFDIMYNEGISKAGDLLDLATAMEIITKRGSFYNYGELRLGQGRENAKDYLRAHHELSSEIEMAVRERAASGETALGFGGVSDESNSDDGDL
jgi:recombination protein RecA